MFVINQFHRCDDFRPKTTFQCALRSAQTVDKN